MRPAYRQTNNHYGLLAVICCPNSSAVRCWTDGHYKIHYLLASIRRILSANSDMISNMISEKNSEIISEFMSEFTSEVPLRTSFQGNHPWIYVRNFLRTYLWIYFRSTDIRTQATCHHLPWINIWNNVWNGTSDINSHINSVNFCLNFFSEFALPWFHTSMSYAVYNLIITHFLKPMQNKGPTFSTYHAILLQNGSPTSEFRNALKHEKTQTTSKVTHRLRNNPIFYCLPHTVEIPKG